MIEVDHLSMSFGEHTVLSDVNVRIARGEVISVIGPSDTGKSTFLRCLNLLERPTGGRIRIDGVDVLDRHADVPRIRRKMNMVFQSFHLFSHLTALENLTLGPTKLLGVPRELFCEKQILSRPTRHNVLLLTEELLTIYRPVLDASPVDVILSYSEKKDRLELALESEGEAADPLDESRLADDLGLRIVRGLAEGIECRSEGGRNRLSLTVKRD